MTETTELVEDSTKTMETGQVLLLIGIKVLVTIRVLETVPWSKLSPKGKQCALNFYRHCVVVA